MGCWTRIGDSHGLSMCQDGIPFHLTLRLSSLLSVFVASWWLDCLPCYPSQRIMALQKGSCHRVLPQRAPHSQFSVRKWRVNESIILQIPRQQAWEDGRAFPWRELSILYLVHLRWPCGPQPLLHPDMHEQRFPTDTPRATRNHSFPAVSLFSLPFGGKNIQVQMSKRDVLTGINMNSF